MAFSKKEIVGALAIAAIAKFIDLIFHYYFTSPFEAAGYFLVFFLFWFFLGLAAIKIRALSETKLGLAVLAIASGGFLLIFYLAFLPFTGEFASRLTCCPAGPPLWFGIQEQPPFPIATALFTILHAGAFVAAIVIYKRFLEDIIT